MSWNEISAYICSAVFFLLTGLKMLFPAFAADASEAVMGVIDRNGSLKSAALVCGEIISASDESITAFLQPQRAELGSAEEEASPAPSSAAAPEPSKPKTELCFDEVYYHLRELARETVKAESERRAEAAAELQRGEEAAAAFLEAQSEFSYLGEPESVSYSYVQLGFDYASPIAGTTQSSGFGYRLHPILGEVRFHYGTDISAVSGESIGAFAEGTVLSVGNDPDGYGLYVIIEHESGFTTLYAHCSKLVVSAGEEVALGQTVAYVGETGLATGPHLHFELMQDGVYLNPEYYIGGAATL